ncbi:MAG: hypothetical protein WAM14_19425 [Candidatus Nitrosopolaris sp.]
MKSYDPNKGIPYCSIIGCNNKEGKAATLFNTDEGVYRDVWLCYKHNDEWIKKVDEVNAKHHDRNTPQYLNCTYPCGCVFDIWITEDI